jgi:HEAT repeat protein
VTFEKDTELRACGVTALGVMETERDKAVPVLTGIAQNKAEWPNVSAAALQALATAAPEEPATLSLAREALQDDRSLVRVAAARVLWKLKAPAAEVLPVLTALLGHKLASVRLAALDGMAEMGAAAQPSQGEVERLLADEHEPVRRSAAAALRRMGENVQGGA